MNDSAASPYAVSPYATYWKAWGALLVLTLLMALTSSPALIVLGIAAKSTIILAWFMHLKDERLDFVIYVVGSLVLFSWLFFYLLMPDARAM